MAQQVDLAQAYNIEKVANGGRMLSDACRGRRWVGIPEAGQIGGKNRAPGPRDGEKTLESAPGQWARMQAKQRSALLEATARRDGIVDVQLPVAALEITPADAGGPWRFRGGWTAGGGFFRHGGGLDCAAVAVRV